MHACTHTLARRCLACTVRCRVRADIDARATDCERAHRVAEESEPG